MYLKNCLKKVAVIKTHLQVRHGSTDLKSILAEKIPLEQKRVLEFRKKHGNAKVGEVTVNMIYGGMRGLKAMIYETSVVDPMKGITFRGYSIPECRKKLPKAEGGLEPLPEGLFWLLLTGDLPNKAQVRSLSKEWAKRSFLPDYVKKMLNNLPKSVHPMAQLTSACTILNTESQFKAAYNKGMHKSKYWEYCYEDCMDLIGKVISIAAIIYLNTYRGGSSGLGGVNPDNDWAANFTNMLGFRDNTFTELMRLYLVLHCDHEGGNVSAHTTTLVASALSDPYLSYAAGMNGLAGPLHGLANQEVVIWLQEIRKTLGDHPSNERVKDFVWKTLKSGRVVPGYGHAVLRATDPRYTCQKEFAEKHIKNDPLLDLVKQIYEVVPPILKELGKVQNPWPNVDAHSGPLLMHFGMTEMTYYTVLFAISRALGVLANMIWARALGLPIERPKSISTNDLMKFVGAR